MLDPNLSHWLDSQAEALDTGACDPDTLLQALSQAGLPKVGVDRALGGDGGTLHDAIETVAAVAGHSLTAAFVLWGQRAFIEYVLHTPNEALRERLEYLAGRHGLHWQPAALIQRLAAEGRGFADYRLEA